MQIKEIELKVEKLTKTFKVRKTKEKWSTVKFGDKEFIMTKELANFFTKNIYHGSIFHLYFDADSTILEEYRDPIFRRYLKESDTTLKNLFLLDNACFLCIPIAANRKSVKKCKFIVLNEDTELYSPKELNLIAKENGLALYITDNSNDKILYKNDKKYTAIFDYDTQTVIFDTEKPLNEETFNLIKRLHHESKNNTIKYISYDHAREFEIGILDDNINAYIGKNHYILALENAEIVKVLERDNEKLVAIKGDKTYIELKNKRYTQTEEERSWHKDKNGVYYIPYTSKYKMFDYEFNIVNILKEDEYGTIIAQIPNLDTEIKVKKFIKEVEPMLIDTRNEYWDYIESEPKLAEEKTYKLKELLRKLSSNYKASINLPACA